MNKVVGQFARPQAYALRNGGTNAAVKPVTPAPTATKTSALRDLLTPAQSYSYNTSAGVR